MDGLATRAQRLAHSIGARPEGHDLDLRQAERAISQCAAVLMRCSFGPNAVQGVFAEVAHHTHANAARYRQLPLAARRRLRQVNNNAWLHVLDKSTLGGQGSDLHRLVIGNALQKRHEAVLDEPPGLVHLRAGGACNVTARRARDIEWQSQLPLHASRHRQPGFAAPTLQLPALSCSFQNVRALFSPVS